MVEGGGPCRNYKIPEFQMPQLKKKLYKIKLPELGGGVGEVIEQCPNKGKHYFSQGVFPYMDHFLRLYLTLPTLQSMICFPMTKELRAWRCVDI